MAIDIKDLKFDKKDLLFFKKQLIANQMSKITIQESETLFKIMSILKNEASTDNKSLPATILIERLKWYNANISTAELRHLIALIRRKTSNLFLDYDGFITATNQGYKISYINTKQGRQEIISYFQKTQTRWKLTFSEIYNLMELLNKFPDEKKGGKND